MFVLPAGNLAGLDGPQDRRLVRASSFRGFGEGVGHGVASRCVGGDAPRCTLTANYRLTATGIEGAVSGLTHLKGTRLTPLRFQ